MRTNRRHSVLFAAALSCWAFPATAQDASTKAMAEALFDQGLDLFDKGKIEDACGRFEESQRLDPKLHTLVNEATCHARLGRTASAWQEFTEAAARADKEGQSDLAKDARSHASELGAKLSMLRLSKSGDTPGLTVTIDGKPGAFGAPLPLDPGTHKLEAKAAGYVTWNKDVEVPQGPADVPQEVPALTKDQSAPPPNPGDGDKPPPHKHEKKPWSMPPVAIASFAIGGVTLVTGIATGAASIAMTNTLSDKCKPSCPEPERSNLSTANALANVSNVTFAVTGVAAIVGIVVVATSLSSSSATDDKRDTGGFDLVPVGDAGAGVRVRF
jgi:hypothetical protein